MSRYIEADTYRKKWADIFDSAYGDSCCEMFKKSIDEQPTADVVEVVRCKDCKHGELGINPNDNTECVYCDTLDEVWEVDDFCVMGERREDDKERSY